MNKKTNHLLLYLIISLLGSNPVTLLSPWDELAIMGTIIMAPTINTMNHLTMQGGLYTGRALIALLHLPFSTASFPMQYTGSLEAIRLRDQST